MDFREKLNKTSWIVTAESPWCEKWDDLQRSSSSGMFTQTTSWLSSYKAYGFGFELLLKVDQRGDILAGFGNLIVKAGPFTSYVCSWGPFLEDPRELDEALTKFVERAKQLKSFVAQINPGAFDYDAEWSRLLADRRFQEGSVLKKIYAPVDFNLIQLPSIAEEEYEKVLLKRFSENAKRNVKAGLKNQLAIQKVKTKEDTEKAYKCFESNAAREGYTVRAWEDIKESLWNAVETGNSILFFAENEGVVIGAIWAAKGGQMLSYIMGGVDRMEKDLKLGHLLQWHCMLEAVALGYGQYNISVGGSEGVVRFKNSFYPLTVKTTGPKFLVLDNVCYSIFKRLFPFFERNKLLAAKILKLIR